MDLTWPLILAGGALFQVAGLTQVIYRRVHPRMPTPLFFAIELSCFFSAAVLVGVGMTDDLYFSLVFASIFLVFASTALVLVWRKVFVTDS